ncbi:hypothetical protein GCM10017778_30690 [Streptomyces vinaceus]|nr:hypothetical protein GCM10017778_30690 [Streptomyces vinaceus]
MADTGVGERTDDLGLGDGDGERVAVDHGQAPNLVLGHGPQDLRDVVVGTDGDRLTLGELAGRITGGVPSESLPAPRAFAAMARSVSMPFRS